MQKILFLRKLKECLCIVSKSRMPTRLLGSLQDIESEAKAANFLISFVIYYYLMNVKAVSSTIH